MIVKMTKYNFVLLKSRHEAFLSNIQDLGLIDVTTSGWEPSDADRELLSSIDKHKACITTLGEIASKEGFTKVEGFGSAAEAFDTYVRESEKMESASNAIQRCEKELEELAIWGDFSATELEELDKNGIKLSFYSTYNKEYKSQIEQWQQDYTVVTMDQNSDVVYFVVVSEGDKTVEINAQQLKSPAMNYSQKQDQIKSLQKQVSECEKALKKCACSLDMIKAEEIELRNNLQFSQVYASASPEAEGALVVMEAWAASENIAEVDAVLESYPDMVYLKADPTPEDQTPVLLKNNKFSRLFELIGSFYSLPKYGTMDLTAFFGPFYMIFFGFCLGDGGYGLLFVLLGLAIKIKKIKELSDVASLTILCGLSTLVFGCLTGSFFGIQLANVEALGEFRKYILTSDNLFNLAIGIGIFQILLAMIIKIINISIQFGFKFAIAPLGWIIVIVSSLVALLGGIESFTMSSLAYQIAAGAGLVMMLFLNDPRKNPLANFGVGLWNTYNDLTGLMGDILSYIRLFAIGLSGSILALVFNDLAFGMSPDVPVLGVIVTIIILLIGHGINLFMSSLSSFVHPMRLTFVEFYKNAGFESAERAFKPFKKEIK